MACGASSFVGAFGESEAGGRTATSGADGEWRSCAGLGRITEDGATSLEAAHNIVSGSGARNDDIGCIDSDDGGGASDGGGSRGTARAGGRRSRASADVGAASGEAADGAAEDDVRADDGAADDVIDGDRSLDGDGGGVVAGGRSDVGWACRGVLRCDDSPDDGALDGDSSDDGLLDDDSSDDGPDDDHCLDGADGDDEGVDDCGPEVSSCVGGFTDGHDGG